MVKLFQLQRELALKNTLEGKILEIFSPELQVNVYSKETRFYGDPECVILSLIYKTRRENENRG